MGYKTLFEQIKTVCAWNSLTRKHSLEILRNNKILGSTLREGEGRRRGKYWESFSFQNPYKYHSLTRLHVGYLFVERY